MSDDRATGVAALTWARGAVVFREQRLSQAFVELADTLIDDFDVVDFMTLLTERCVELLGATDGGLMLVDPLGDLRVVASSSEQMRTLEIIPRRDRPVREKTEFKDRQRDLALQYLRGVLKAPR